MKSARFRRDELSIEWRRPREGPPSFLVYVPGKSWIALTSDQLFEGLMEEGISADDELKQFVTSSFSASEQASDTDDPESSESPQAAPVAQVSQPA